jgi:hypothetical protein
MVVAAAVVVAQHLLLALAVVEEVLVYMDKDPLVPVG